MRKIVLLVVVATAIGLAPASAASATSAPCAAPLGHAVVFTRFLPGDELGEVYRIDPGSASAVPLHSAYDAAILSPDATRFLDFAPAPGDSGTTGIFNVDGSGYRTLPAHPTLVLPGGVWTSGGARIATEGWDPNDPSSVGIYSRSASDGAGLIRLSAAGSRHDYPAKTSPDGSKLLFFRPDRPNETSDSAAQDLFVVGSRGGHVTRLTPDGVTTAIPFSHGSVSWSPDGSKVAVVAANGPFWNTTRRSVYLADADGYGFTPIGPRGDIWEAVWSPDGRWIAFTMATASTGGLHELYLMRPSGAGVRRLTSGANGLYARDPVWSPDSEQILFIRGTDSPDVGNLFVVNADGSGSARVTHTAAAYRAAAWLPE